MVTSNILRNRLSIRVEPHQQPEQPKYCITVFRGEKVTTICGEDLDRLVEAAHAVSSIDIVTLRLSQKEKDLSLSRKIEKKGLFDF